MEKIKEIKITFGRFIALVVAVSMIGSGAIVLARYGDVNRHEERSIERAHPGIIRYVSRETLQKSLITIEKRLTAIETLLRERLPPKSLDHRK
jgi:hypothetical protein